MSLWLGLSASEGASRSVGMKVFVQRMEGSLYTKKISTQHPSAGCWVLGAVPGLLPEGVAGVDLELGLQLHVLAAARVRDRGADPDLEVGRRLSGPALGQGEEGLPFALAFGLDLRVDPRGRGVVLFAR